MSHREYMGRRWMAYRNGAKVKRRKGTCSCPICIGRFDPRRVVREREALRHERVAW